jgi:hypothetical protein
MKNESKGATAKSAEVPGAVAGISGRRRKFSVSTETAYCKHFRLLAENFGRPRNFRRVVRSAGISGEQLGPTGLIVGSVAGTPKTALFLPILYIPLSSPLSG